MTRNSNTTRKKSLKVYLFDDEKAIIEDKAAAYRLNKSGVVVTVSGGAPLKIPVA